MPDQSDVNSGELAVLDDLNAAQMEILCDLECIKADIALQNFYATKLFHAYDNGVEGLVATDKWKAQKYAKILKGNTEKLKKEAQRIKTEELEREEKLSKEAQRIKEASEIQETQLRTENLFSIYRIFDRCRLFLSRTARLVNMQNSTMHVLATPLTYMSLGTGVRLFVDIAILFRPIYNPTKEEKELNLSWGKRISSQWKKDNRRKRMFNDLFWFPLNLAAIICAPFTFGLTLIIFNALQLTGFGWDVANEGLRYSGAKRAKDHDELLKKLEDHITALNNIKRDTQEEIEKFTANHSLTSQINISTEMTQLQNKQGKLEEEITKYAKIKDKLIESARQEKRKLYYNFAMACVVFVGMGLFFFFPPTAMLGAAIIIGGACFALLGGSLLNGLGKEIYDTVGSWFKKDAKKTTPPVTESIVTHKQESTNSINNTSNNIVTNMATAPTTQVVESNSITVNPAPEGQQDKKGAEKVTSPVTENTATSKQDSTNSINAALSNNIVTHIITNMVIAAVNQVAESSSIAANSAPEGCSNNNLSDPSLKWTDKVPPGIVVQDQENENLSSEDEGDSSNVDITNRGMANNVSNATKDRYSISIDIFPEDTTNRDTNISIGSAPATTVKGAPDSSFEGDYTPSHCSSTNLTTDRASDTWNTTPNKTAGLNTSNSIFTKVTTKDFSFTTPRGKNTTNSSENNDNPPTPVFA